MSARSEQADSERHLYARYTTLVYVVLILTGQYHFINNRVDRKTWTLLTGSGHTQIAHLDKAVRGKLGRTR